MVTLESLIKEQKERISQLKYEPNPPGCLGFAYYYYEKSDEYQKWLATTKRYIGIIFPNDKDVTEFEKISKEKLSPNQQEKLLAILEAFYHFPTVIQSNVENHKGITVNTNINNSNNQSQSQDVTINIFLDAIKADLTGKQLKELREVINDSRDDKDKAKKNIIDKLKSFGSDVATNIVANILTNPIIWSGL